MVVVVRGGRCYSVVVDVFCPRFFLSFTSMNLRSWVIKIYDLRNKETEDENNYGEKQIVEDQKITKTICVWRQAGSVNAFWPLVNKSVGVRPLLLLLMAHRVLPSRYDKILGNFLVDTYFLCLLIR